MATQQQDINLPKNLFTSGVCLESNLCLYEAYIEKNKLFISIDKLKQKFSEIDNVINVIIEDLKEVEN